MNKSKTALKKILLADDDDDDCILFKDALNEIHINADFKRVRNGEELMNLLHKPGTILPDLLFLDINMPRKNGFECLDEIKNNVTLKHLPVIVFSTSSAADIVNRMFRAGANLYICKPNQYSQLKYIIQKTLTFNPPDLRCRSYENFFLSY